HAWAANVEMAKGDALDYASVERALDGIDVVFYLIHSLGAGEGEFSERDRTAAGHFARAAQERGVRRIMYLGGLRPEGGPTSEHLQSRLDTGETLRSGSVPVTEFRAGVIVGSGSLSFELIRYLTERLPAMICPRWVDTETHPIAVRDVLRYLVDALDIDATTGRIVEIGGADVLTYAQMFETYARVRGLRRWIVRVPLLTPRLSSHWVGLVTPLTATIAKPLIKGLDSPVKVQDTSGAALFDIEPISYEAAVRLALRRFDDDAVTTSWHGALSSGPPEGESVSELEDREGLFVETRRVFVPASPGDVWTVIVRLGGQTGWLYADALWELRGLADLAVGGVGLRRGRRSATALRAGDALDFWRVESIEPPHLLRLRAEMKVPGRAWLEFRIAPVESGGGMLSQTAFFEPRGLAGFLYWYGLYPVHRIIFRGMLDRIKERVEAAA
ncbi:MAG: SDR family oxidoreductase, partial [Rhodothermales bacterium]